MKTDIYGEQLITEDELSALLLRDSNILQKVTQILNPEQYNRSNREFGNPLPKLDKKFKIDDSQTVAQLDQDNQNCWFMPDEYKNKDILAYLLSLCKTPPEIARVNEEFVLFEQKNLVNVLKFANYMVDVAKANDIILGVGRGSSTSCFCLFLLGLHKINSLQYNLDIKEFFKE